MRHTLTEGVSKMDTPSVSPKGFCAGINTKILIVTCYLLLRVFSTFTSYISFHTQRREVAKIYSEHGKHGTNENNNPHNADLRPEGARLHLAQGIALWFCIQCDFIRPERA